MTPNALKGVRLENGIYGHSRFCNKDEIFAHISPIPLFLSSTIEEELALNEFDITYMFLTSWFRSATLFIQRRRS